MTSPREARALKRARSSDLALMLWYGYYQRDKTRGRTLAIIPWHSFAASNSEGTNYFFSLSFSVLFNFLPQQTLNICIEYIFQRNWHHNPDDSTDIIFRLILSVLPFSLISSCVIHHQLLQLFLAAQFQGMLQGQMICFHY